MKKFNFWEYKFPVITDLHLAFGYSDIPDELLTAAKQAGFYNTHTIYNKEFNNIFFNGGRTLKIKQLENEEQNAQGAAAGLYARAMMISWGPKHEHKEAVCAFVFSHIFSDESL